MLVAFRFLTGCTGAAPLSIGGGSITDMMAVEHRGVAMAVFAVGPLLGAIIGKFRFISHLAVGYLQKYDTNTVGILGPVAGGYLSQRAGWRWVFRVIAIAIRIALKIYYGISL